MSQGEITVLLQAAKTGQPGALDRLFSKVYDELRKIAQNRIISQNRWTDEPTTLVHDFYLRLINRDKSTWENRHHFFWAAVLSGLTQLQHLLLPLCTLH